MFILRTFRFPRHPLARILFGFVGLVMAVIVITFGAFLGVFFLSIGAIVWLIRQIQRHQNKFQYRPFESPSSESPTIIEGDYVLIEKEKRSKH